MDGRNKVEGNKMKQLTRRKIRDILRGREMDSTEIKEALNNAPLAMCHNQKYRRRLHHGVGRGEVGRILRACEEFVQTGWRNVHKANPTGGSVAKPVWKLAEGY